MVKVTVDVPEALLGDLYIRVGAVLRRGLEEAADADSSGGGADDEHGSEQDDVSARLTGSGQACD